MGEVTPYPASSGGLQLQAPERLSSQHDVASFDCGHDDLNAWLAHQAASSDGKISSDICGRAWCSRGGVLLLGGPAPVKCGQPFPKQNSRQGLPDQVPVVVIGRLAVDKNFQIVGDSERAYSKTQSLRSLDASDLVGVRAIVVHAIDERAGEFYLKFGFLPSPTNARTFVLPLEDGEGCPLTGNDTTTQPAD